MESGITVFGTLGLLAVLIFGFFSFDCVVKAQYECNHAAWLENGKPNGFYWRARECDWWSSGWASMRLAMFWLFKTPDWAKQSLTAKVWLKRYRMSILTWNLGSLLGAALYLIHS